MKCRVTIYPTKSTSLDAIKRILEDESLGDHNTRFYKAQAALTNDELQEDSWGAKIYVYRNLWALAPTSGPHYFFAKTKPEVEEKVKEFVDKIKSKAKKSEEYWM